MQNWELLTRSSAIVFNLSSVVAPTEHYLQAPAGESYLVHEFIAYHDDPGGADLSWRIKGPAVPTITIPIGATATGIRVRLGAYYSMPVILVPEWVIYIIPSAALAAGTRLYIEAHVHLIRGLPGGVWT